MQQDDGYTKGRQSWHAAAAAGYTVKLLASAASVLVLFVAIAHLPARPRIQRVGWDVARPHYPIQPHHLQQLTGRPTNRAPQTRFSESLPAAPQKPDPVDESTWDGSTEPVQTIEPAEPLKPVLAFAEEPPTIRGGIGAYYIHIEYPPDAIKADVEGSLLLEFVVEPDGKATNITVVKSLYPSCDSSAVQALRKTFFVPGRQNGKEVRVRMSLPVRFVLLPAEPATDESQSDGLRSP